ncbi:HEAT repeat domain-containing protein [Desulfosporosinus sp.]|uniref:HEAT repeat domain-containing protein n=1 Tax=Desulfosporosinus sp. TaxID=157907 RepID=UPI0025C65FC3|nr:HEAT repeat domain-containing protein [Desulfosporosinus sp.]MBC2725122.1 HEAT repeat domain-containing protein [Desulfosporosinus sp.]
MTIHILTLIIFLIIILTGLIFLSILRLRYKFKRDYHQRKEAYSKWELNLFSLFAEEIHPSQWASHISSHELGYLQEFLLPYLESLKGESFEKLVAVAHYSGLVKHLLQEGGSANDWKQAQSIYFLGLIREPQGLPMLETGLASDNMFWFYPSIIALARNNLKTLPRVLEVLRNRSDWTEHLGISIFAEMGEEVCPELLSVLSKGETSPKVERLALAVLAHFGYKRAEATLKEYILYSKDPELQIRALRAWNQLKLTFFEGIALAMKHSDWEIRAAAVTALGSSGAVNHALLARPLLRDSNWWVRLRAAQAMLVLCTREELHSMLDDPLEDRYAKDMLRYILTREGGATCVIPITHVL